MEHVLGMVSSAVSSAAEYTMSPVAKHVKHLFDHENNVRSLKRKAESLDHARKRVRLSVDAAKRNGEEIHEDVDTWLDAVDKKIDEAVEKVKQDEERAKEKCFLGLCLNFLARYNLSRKAEKEAKAVDELLQQGSFDKVGFRPPPQPATNVKGFQAFESRALVLNGIMEALRDASVSMIGVHGMGGVGKTTLVKEVARQVEVARLFDTVVIATVSQSLDVEKIQNHIAESVGLTLGEKSSDVRARRLRDRLNKEKKILVVLDDIWERLDLEQVGIPYGDEHKGCCNCKILLTSRDLNVLSHGMDTQINFGVGILTEQEAWDFFKKMAGDCVDSSDLRPIAIEVANKCAGLPVAIATVARALRNKSLFEWTDALRQLKRPAASTDHKEVTGAVHSAIELSYNYLKSNEYKFTFLLCNLLGHHSLIEDLLRYAIGLRVFSSVYTMQEARNRVLTVVNKLKASCLLLDSYDSECFDIHDVVCDVALSIASREYPMFVMRDGEKLERWPSKEMMTSCSAINLCQPRVMIELPDKMEGSHLSFFRMKSYGQSIIPDNFFRGSKKLQVLDLTSMHFLYSPPIDVLTNLQTLCLNKCELGDVSIVGKLKMLDILSLANSDIEALPKEVAQLTQLRLLDLSGCTQLQIIPPNVLASLSKLEELYMDNSFDQWEDEANASLEELKHLSHLTTLHVRIPNAEIIPKDLFTKTLDRYRISIGAEDDYCDAYVCSRTLSISGMNASIYMDNGVKMLLKNVVDLYLDQLEGVKHVLSELNDGEGFPSLKELHIINSMDLQYIAVEKIEMSQLRSMTLLDLPQLISFCSEETKCSTSHQLEEGDISSIPLPLSNKQFVFPHLESLTIVDCGKLEHLFSPSTARSMVQLKSLEISHCNCLRDVIFTDVEEENNDPICFPQLKSIVMYDLQNLVEFCSTCHQIEFPWLETLKIERCPLLKEFVNSEKSSQFGRRALFNDKVAVPCLEKLTISGLKTVKMLFDKELIADSFSKLQEMKVDGCDELLAIFSSSRDAEGILTFGNLRKVNIWGCRSLKNVFSPSVARSLVQLKSLEIRECNCLRDVIFTDGTEEEKNDVIRFPQLNSLVMKDLQNLIEFCSSASSYKIEFPSLKTLEIERCPQLKEFLNNSEENCRYGIRALFNDKFVFPHLESLSILTLYCQKSGAA